MTFVSILGLYEAAANAAEFLVALQPVPNRGYWYAYSYGQIGESLLSCLLAIEITSLLLPRKQFALAWCGGIATLVAMSLGNTLPPRREAALLNASLACDFICALVLVALLWIDRLKPPHHLRFIIAGVLLPAGFHALCAVDWLNRGLSPAVQSILPLASLAGLILLFLGSITNSSQQMARW
jgi:hypothetical protein